MKSGDSCGSTSLTTPVGISAETLALLCDRECRPVAAEVFEGKPLWRRLIGTMGSDWSTLRRRVVMNAPSAPN